MEENINKSEKSKEEIAKEKLESFLSIVDQDGGLIYKTSMEELESIVSDVLSMGNYTKEFSILNGKLELVYSTLLEKDRQVGYELVRKYTDDNKDASRIQIETYTSKVNIALHAVRVVTNGTATNLSTGKIEERLQLLAELPEPVVISLDKYLRVFLNIVNKAFNSEDVIKN